tara:strand:+ start:246 stop:500 length:255 start_codon:yes stop_codon:yes gene_type:complete
MKYNLSTAGYFYTSGSPTHSTLLKLGFKFTKATLSWGDAGLWIEKPEPTIEINTLEELRDLEKLVGCSLVISDDNITIYDDYME